MSKADKTAILSTLADFFTGMSTAWAFVAWAATNNAFSSSFWEDLIKSSAGAILSLGIAIGIKLKL